MQSQEINKLAEALIKFRADVGPIAKDKVNPHFKSSYADLATILDAVVPVLTKYGLVVTQPTCFHDGHLFVKTILIHTSGQWISGEYLLAPSKNDPQGYMAALTYARRGSLAAVLNVCGESDDDGNAASAAPVPAARPQKVERVSEPVEGKIVKTARVVIKNMKAPPEGKKSWGFVTSEDEWFNASDETLVNELKMAKADRRPRMLTYELDGRWKWVRDVARVEEAVPAGNVEIPF